MSNLNITALETRLNQTTTLAEHVERDVYILSGVFGGLIFIIICFLFYVVTVVDKLEKKIKGKDHHQNTNGRANPEPVYDDIERRFTQYPPVRARVDDRFDQRAYAGNFNAQLHQDASRNPLTQQQFGAIPPTRSSSLNRNPGAAMNDIQQQPRGLRNYDSYGY